MLRRRFLSAKRQQKLRKQKAFTTRQRRLRFEGLENRRVLAAFTWDGNSDGDGDGISWNDPLNWTGDAAFPNGTGDSATFTDNDPGQVDINGHFAVGQLFFNSTTTTRVLRAIGPTKSLTIDDGSGGGLVSQSAFSVNTNNTFSDALILKNATVFDIPFNTIFDVGTNVLGDEISGKGSIVKVGDGRLAVSGQIGNTFTGGVIVNAGILSLNSLNLETSLLGTGDVIVNNNSMIRGQGAVEGAVTLNGTSTISPSGILAMGGLTIGVGQKFAFKPNNTVPGPGQGQVVVKGTVNLGGSTLSLDFFSEFVPTPAKQQSIVLISNDGTDSVTGTFANLPEGASLNAPAGGILYITYRGGDGNDVALTTQPVVYGTSGNDTISISGTGSAYTVSVNGISTTIDNPPGLTIEGLDGNDTFIVDYSGGAPGPTFGISFHGGTGAADNDKLVITGGTFASATHTFTTTGPEMSGSIVYNNGVNLPAITYDGLEPIDMTGSTITDLILTLPGTADLPILEDDGIAANGISQLRSGAGTFDTTSFSNTITTLTINLGGDAAAMTVAALPDFKKTLTINGQAGADTVNFTGAANLAALSVTATGGITDGPAAALTVAGTATLSAGTGNITLDSAANNFSTVSVGSGNVVTLRDAGAIDLGPMNVTGNLSVTSAGAITDTGPLLIGQRTTLQAGAANDITLDNPANNLGNVFVSVLSGNNVTLRNSNDISLGPTNVSGALGVTAAGNITDQGALITVAGLMTLTAGAANDITLTALTSNFNTVTVVSADDVTLTDANAIEFAGVSTISGDLTVTAGGTITDAAATTLNVAGLASFNAGANSITLGDNVADVTNFGSVSLAGTAVNVSEDSAATFDNISAEILIYTAAGAIDDGTNGNVNVSSGSIFAATSNITLGNDAGNTTNFGTLTFNSPAPVSIAEDSDSLLSGTSTALSLTLSSAGSITYAAGASVTVTTTSSMTATTAISTAGNAANVLNVGGNASFSGSPITVAAPGTANFGSLTFNSTGAVSITEDSDTILSGTSTAQSLTLTSAGSITDAAGASVTVANNSSMSATTAVSLADNAADVLSVGGNASFSGSSITVAAPGTANFNNVNFTSPGAVTITEDSDMVLTGSNASTAGSLILSSPAGSITDRTATSITVLFDAVFTATANIILAHTGANALNVGGNASFTGASIAVETFTAADFGTLTFNSIGAVSIGENSDTNIAGTNTAGSLDLFSSGGISDTAATSVSVTGLADFTGSSISLGGGIANFGSLSFHSAGPVVVGEDSATRIEGTNTAASLDIDSAGELSDAGGTSLSVINLANFSGTSIAVGAGVANFGSVRFNSAGAVTIDENSDMVLSGASTALSLALTASSISDAVGASITVSGDAAFTAVSIQLADNPTDILSIGEKATFKGKTISVATPGAANFGSLGFNSTVTVDITEDSSTLIAGANTAGDATVVSAGDITVSGSINATGNITLRAAGNVAIQASAALTADSAAANTITLAVDNSNPSATAKTIDIDNAATLKTNITSLTSGGVFLVGGDDNDTFIFQPRSTTRFVVTGNAPAFGTLPGDRLSIDLSPPAIASGNATLTLGTPAGAGAFTFGSESERPVEYTGIEDINAVGGQYHLVLDMFVSGFQNGVADTVNAAVSAANLNLTVNAAPFFADDVASLLSLSILGSSDVDQVNVNAISVLTSIDGRDNNDVITVASTGAVTTASGGAGDDQLILLQASNPVTLQGRDGEDTFTLASGSLASLTVVPSIIGGELGESTTRPVREGGISAGTAPFFRPHIVAKSIADKLILNDQTSTADAAFSIFGGSVNKNGANVATYSQIELLRLNAGSGNDDIAAFMDFGALPNIVQVSSGNNAFTENRLQVEGTASGDDISIGDLNDATEATAPHRAAFELQDVKRAWVRGLGGNDVIDNISQAIGLFDGGTGDDFINFVSATPLPSKYNPGVKPKVAQNVSIVLGNVGKDFLFAGAGDGGNLRGSAGQDLGPYADLGRVILMGDHGLNAGNKLVAVNGGKGQKGDFYHFSSSAPKHSFVAFGDNQASAVKGNNFIAPTFDKIKFSSTIAWLKVQLFVGAGQIRSIVNLLNTQVAQHVKAPATPPRAPITSPLAIPLPAAPPAGEGESLLATNAFHNALEAGDVDGDGHVSPLDAVLIINDLNARGSRKLSSLGEGESESLHFLDVDGDSFVSPLDAVLVINALNAAPAAASSTLDDDDLLGLLASDQAA